MNLHVYCGNFCAVKNILCLFFLLPVTLCAQLDRIDIHMRVAEFQTAFPEAKRNYDAEAYSAEQPDTLNAVGGSSRWFIYKDTVKEYRFLSEVRFGPSAAAPGSDSSAVHELKTAAETLRKELENQFGKPSAVINVSFSDVSAGTSLLAYRALWSFGYNDFILLEVAADLEPVNLSNRPNKPSGTRRTPYHLRVEVGHRSSFTQLNYGTGQSASVFFQNRPAFKSQQPQLHEAVFTFEDSVGFGGHWKFIFANDSLKSISYHVYAGTAFRSPSDADAYPELKAKADALVKEAGHSFGAADTLNNMMTPRYVPHERYEAYNVTHLYGAWMTRRGPVIIQYVEIGGGKNPDTIFHLSVWFGTE